VNTGQLATDNTTSSNTSPLPDKSFNRWQLFWARFWVGLIILFTAEILSGASLVNGLWSPLVWLLVYPLYAAHFFLLINLALRTGRTSLTALYFWGVMFGLYEPWITKVIWHGYSHDGMPILGRMGAFGFAELSMLVLFHPVMSLILPLAIVSLFSPAVATQFPCLEKVLGKHKTGKLFRISIVFMFSLIMSYNSGGAANLIINLILAVILFAILAKVARPALRSVEGMRILTMSHKGLWLTGLYLVALYGLTYFYITPQGLPDVSIQILTACFYLPPIACLMLLRRRPAVLPVQRDVQDQQVKMLQWHWFLLMLLSVIFTILPLKAITYPLIWIIFIFWTPFGFALAVLAMVKALRESRQGFEPIRRGQVVESN